jgi:hypothetical protein
MIFLKFQQWLLQARAGRAMGCFHCAGTRADEHGACYLQLLGLSRRRCELRAMRFDALTFGLLSGDFAP